MAVMDAFRRGWGWVWLLGLGELAFVGLEARSLMRPAPPPPHLAPPAAAQPADSPARVSLQPILDFQPFGTPDAPPPATVPDTPQVDTPPPSPLTDGYVLQGVLLGDDAVPSRAILLWNGDQPATYTTGDTLPSGATLAGVEANRVWLEKDGDRQFLEFPASGNTLPDPDTPAPDSVSPNAVPPDSNASDPAAPAATAPAATAPAASASAPAPQIMPQPDLRNLIPGLPPTAPPAN